MSKFVLKLENFSTFILQVFMFSPLEYSGNEIPVHCPGSIVEIREQSMDEFLATSTASLVKRKFISQTEIEEAKAKRQKEWEDVKGRVDQAKGPPEEEEGVYVCAWREVDEVSWDRMALWY